MHLIAPVASGIRGAEAGTVTLYRRGTSTLVTYYEDFEGTEPVIPSGAITLDSLGRAVLYVNELTQVVVKDSTGTTVLDFVAGTAASSEELISTSFAGVDYVTGQSGASKPTTVKRAFDKFITSFGALDGNVLFRDTTRKLYEVLKGLDCFYNVKDPLYGARGDGIADDTAAIQAAMNAAEAADGGIVFIPAGEYVTSAPLSMDVKVSLLGAGPKVSIINNAETNSGLLAMAGTMGFSAEQSSIRGVAFTSQGNINSGTAITSAVHLNIDNCVFGGDLTGTFLALTNGDGQHANVTINNCMFAIAGAAQSCIVSDAYALITNCLFQVPEFEDGSYTGTVIDVENASVQNCGFDASLTAAGTFYYTRTKNCRVENCSFGPTAGATGTAFLHRSDAAPGTLYEAGNVFDEDLILYELGSSLAWDDFDGVILKSRENRIKVYSIDLTGAVEADNPALEYGSLHIEDSTHAATTPVDVNLPAAPPGCKLVVAISNKSGNANTYRIRTFADYTIGRIPNAGPVSLSVASNSQVTFILESVFFQNIGANAQDDAPLWVGAFSSSTIANV